MSNLTDLLWQAVEPVMFITKEQFLASLCQWEIDIIETEGEPAFITLTRGPEFHIHSVGSGRRIPLREIERRIGVLVERYGYAETRTPKHMAKQRKINEMFGAMIVGEDDLDIHYRFYGRRKCQLLQ